MVQGGVKQFNNIINKYIINKKEKKELFKEVKNINKGEDSFDDGMEYYLVLDSIHISGRYGTSVCSVIMDGKIYNSVNEDQDIIAVSISNKMLMLDYGYTMKEILISYDNDLTDSSKFKRITAKEYYSLLN